MIRKNILTCIFVVTLFVSCDIQNRSNITIGKVDKDGKPYIVDEPKTFPVPDSLGGNKLHGYIHLSLNITKSGKIIYYPTQIYLNDNPLYADQYFAIGARNWKDGIRTKSITGWDTYYRFKQWIDSYYNSCKFIIDTSRSEFKSWDTLYYGLDIQPNKESEILLSKNSIKLESKSLRIPTHLCKNRKQTEFTLILRINKYGKVLRYDIEGVSIERKVGEWDQFDRHRSQAVLQNEYVKYKDVIDKLLLNTTINVESSQKYFVHEQVFPYWVYIKINSKTKNAFLESI